MVGQLSFVVHSSPLALHFPFMAGHSEVCRQAPLLFWQILGEGRQSVSLLQYWLGVAEQVPRVQSSSP
jgi:hypothetical protein